jgi:Putative zinc-finger
MNCWTAKRRSADYIDGKLRSGERARLESHLSACASCSLRVDQTRSLRSALASLPEPALPVELRTALAVAASRERHAVLERRASRLKRIWNRWKFRFDEIMRPLTIPATGGLLSSLILFGALAFTIGVRGRIVSYEVPVLDADRLNVNLVPVELRSSVMLTFSLDGNGRITDYMVRDGSAFFVGNPTRLQYNNILLPEFPSVLTVAQPINRDVSILFRPIVFRP